MRLLLFSAFLLGITYASSQNPYPIYRGYLKNARVKEVLVYTKDSTGNRDLIRHGWVTESGYDSKYVIAGENKGVPDTSFQFAKVITSECDSLGRPVKTTRFVEGVEKPGYTSLYLPNERVVKTFTDNYGETWTIITVHFTDKKLESFTDYEEGKVTYKRIYRLKRNHWVYKVRGEINGKLKTITKGKEYVNSGGHIFRIEQKTLYPSEGDIKDNPELVIFKIHENGLVSERHVWQKAGDDSTKTVEYYEYITRP